MSMVDAPGFAVCLLPPHTGGQDTFQESDIPARSRLYSLAPYEIETIWRESLTGYINRLGRIHHTSPRAFVAEMILAPLTKDLGLRLPAAAAFGADGAMSLNGTGEIVSAGGALLNHLTMRTDLHLLTLPWWVGDLPRRGQLRATPAWCPLCLTEWRDQGRALYQPLLWMFHIVTLCPRHRSPLMDQCLYCQKRQMILATNNTQPGACTSCGTFLGEDPKNFSGGPEHEQQVVWQGWVISVLEDLLTASQADSQVLWEPFFRHLANYLKENQAYSKLARVTGITRQALHRWVKSDDPYAPTFQTLLKFCYVCKVTPLQVMRNQLDDLQQVNERETGSDSSRPQRPVRRVVDRERCQALFQAILDGKEEPLGISQVAQRLGYDEQSLMQYFPQECAEITRRAKAYRKQRKEQRFALIGEQARQATFAVHASGTYPSQHAITPLLPRGAMRLLVAKTAWRTALQGLGLEH
jgi:DNA-binding phage protein